MYPERPLGEGSVGRVMLGRYRNGPLVAIKQVCMQNINEELMKQIKNEFQNMEELCSAYVVKMFGMQVASSVSTIYLFL